MNRRSLFIVMLMFLAGNLLVTETFACGKGSKGKHSAQKSKSVNVTNDADAKPNANACGKASTSKDTDHEGDGKKAGHSCPSDCNHSNCKCLNFCVTIALQAETPGQFYNQAFDIEKTFISIVPVHPSPGFHSIWIIPKIS